MSVPSRETRREKLKVLLEADGSWQAVYDHQPASFGGQSPIATVHNGGVEFPSETFGGDEDAVMELLVTNYVKRDEPDAAEDTLDDLLAAVVDVVKVNRKSAGYWARLEVSGPTEPDYYVVDGVQYRAELIRLQATIYV
jgi:hypothetical protein